MGAHTPTLVKQGSGAMSWFCIAHAIERAATRANVKPMRGSGFARHRVNPGSGNTEAKRGGACSG
jgi:hypothetical protein